MSVVQFEAVGRTFRSGGAEVRALAGVTLQAERGELVAVMGASGSGKTTLLSIAGGLDRADSGRVRVLGEDLGRLSERQLARLRLTAVGFVFQELNLLAELTLEENVALPLEGAGTGRHAARSAARAALARVGLDGTGGRFPDEVSGGQQQRVAIARAVVGNRRLVLADEPTGSLDSDTGAEIMELLRQLCDNGTTVLLSTHNPANADFADRIVHLRDGTLDRIEERAPRAAREDVR
ncbi:ABC transporter ATP-binding protein [Kitasatospora sp. NPDC093679]|uniref:ABC transporter ATP-binding protein n=1 Tax=Kitasatospora sp. NPDC093679 TaxID=3154983 RepID=UPI00342E341B